VRWCGSRDLSCSPAIHHGGNGGDSDRDWGQYWHHCFRARGQHQDAIGVNRLPEGKKRGPLRPPDGGGSQRSMFHSSPYSSNHFLRCLNPPLSTAVFPLLKDTIEITEAGGGAKWRGGVGSDEAGGHPHNTNRSPTSSKVSCAYDSLPSQAKPYTKILALVNFIGFFPIRSRATTLRSLCASVFAWSLFNSGIPRWEPLLPMAVAWAQLIFKLPAGNWLQRDIENRPNHQPRTPNFGHKDIDIRSKMAAPGQ
jgi:hypothetical protein